MTDDELRTLVREAIARRTRPEAHGRVDTDLSGPAKAGHYVLHASHSVLPLERGGDGDGACLIEPSVRCNHCGYCLSYGH